ncbi:unnamed protein product, partial [Vitis vinifera]|uniref:Uncharacterized protein n=1 Tax=Vitis vinifera TaxID=29760 RepID=D7U3F9_VITVI
MLGLARFSRRGDKDPFCVIHKLPSGDAPYARAKRVLMVEKDPEAAIVLFWNAINARDRVESALKDMAVVMKRLDRSEEAIEAIKSFRNLCPKQAQESLDNILIDLYKKCGRTNEHIDMLKQKLRLIYQGEAFNGKPTRTARSNRKKFQITIEQETSRILGNLGWVYMQKSNYMAAEVVYKKAQMIDPDANKACNLALCLINQGRYTEAHSVLKEVLQGKLPNSEDCKAQNRAQELMLEVEPKWLPPSETIKLEGFDLEDDFSDGFEKVLNIWAPFRTKRLPIFVEEISSYRNQLAC